MKTYDITVFTKVLTKEQIRDTINSFFGFDAISKDDIKGYSEMWDVTIFTDDSADMREFAIGISSCVQAIDPKAFAGVKDARFGDSKEYIHWTNDGITAYTDESVYTDPFYRLHFGNYSEYRIVDVEVYSKRMSERVKQRFKGCKFVWECTGCWDMPLRAQTIEDAIEEFEEIYREKLWDSVDSLQLRSRDATRKYQEFDKYRREKYEL